MNLSIKIVLLTTLIMSSGLQGMELWKKLWGWGKDTQNPLNLQLLDAVEKGEIRYLGLLIGEGADVNAQEVKSAYQDTALIEAARRGYTEICELLIAHGADVNKTNTAGSTALIKAAQNGHKKICELLIAHGADVNKNSFLGLTALMYAALDEDNKEICELLINAMIKLTPQERSEIVALLNLKRRNVPGLHPESIKIVAQTRLDDIKREKRHNACTQIMKIENEAMKEELLKYLDNVK